MKNVKFLQLLSAGTDIVSVVNSVDNIEGSMKKLVDNKMINKIKNYFKRQEHMLQLKILICMKICNVYARQGTTDWVGRGGFIFKR